MAFDAELAGKVFGLFAAELARWQEETARAAGVDDPHAGSVMEVQRFANGARIERFFWLDAAAHSIKEASADRREALYREACRRIVATYAVSARDRAEAVRFLADQLVPLR